MNRLISILLPSLLLFIEINCQKSDDFCDNCQIERTNKDGINKQGDKCYPGKAQCLFDDPYILVNKPDDPLYAYSHNEAVQVCKDKGTEIASLYPHLTPYGGVPEGKTLYQQLRAMQDKCRKESVGNHDCWIGGVRDPEQDARWIFRNATNDTIFYIFEDEQQTEDEWRSYSDDDEDFTYWSCHDDKGERICEPDDHGNKRGNPQDCLALYSSREYNISDWECNKEWVGSSWTINNVICKNPDYKPELACNCNCDVCIVRGDPHVDTFDGTYYHPMETPRNHTHYKFTNTFS